MYAHKLLVFFLLYTCTMSAAKKGNYKHVFIKDSEQKEQLVDKFLDLIEASWDYLMQVLYYKANWLGLDKERESSNQHEFVIYDSATSILDEIPGVYMFRDVFMAFMDVLFEEAEVLEEFHDAIDPIKKPRPHGAHGQHNANQGGSHSGHQNNRPHGNRPHQSNQNQDTHSHLAELGSIFHHERSLSDNMEDSGLHKLLVRWRLCE